MSTFTVVNKQSGTVTLRTDDWMAAERAALVRPHSPLLNVKGTHPTHDFVGGRCSRCGARDNGSYGSHAPCGFDFEGRPLIAILQDECPDCKGGRPMHVEPQGYCLTCLRRW